MGEQTKMIKAIVIACLAAVALAEAEADPYLLYGHGLGYYGHGLGYYGGYYGGLRYYGKRSADAEADPYLLYRGHLGYAGPLGYYGGLGHLGYGYGGYYLGK